MADGFEETTEVQRRGQGTEPLAKPEPKDKPPPLPGFTWVWNGQTWVLQAGDGGVVDGVSFGGGGGGGGGAPPDPVVSAGERLYFELWGEAAPPGYIQGLRSQGMNLFEIELHERAKPAFSGFFGSRAAQDEASEYVTALARFLGVGL